VKILFMGANYHLDPAVSCIGLTFNAAAQSAALRAARDEFRRAYVGRTKGCPQSLDPSCNNALDDVTGGFDRHCPL
jgi:hypothetical protein